MAERGHDESHHRAADRPDDLQQIRETGKEYDDYGRAQDEAEPDEDGGERGLGEAFLQHSGEREEHERVAEEQAEAQAEFDHHSEVDVGLRISDEVGGDHLGRVGTVGHES